MRKSGSRMMTQISANNPFGRTLRFDHAFAWEKIATLAKARGSSITVMDYGAHDGAMLRACLDSGLPLTAYGVDANESAITRGMGQVRQGRGLLLGGVADFEKFREQAGGFDVVFLMGVLEHVRQQSDLLNRLRNSLRPGGSLVLSVPGRHFLSWLDFGNWKFYFPRLHKIYIEQSKGRDYYNERFVECRNGLFGDIEIGKGEHQHFSRREMVALLEETGFEVEVVDGYGFSYRLLHNVWWLSPGPLKRLLYPAIRVDLRMGSRTELVTCARR